MVFVNQVSEVVHSQVDKYGGSANKNIGDAFLLVWKFDQNDVQLLGSELVLRKESPKVAQIADLSFFSFIKIVAKINKFNHIINWKDDQEL